MDNENVVVVRFTEPSRAYQALSVLKECDADGRIGLESAAVVERTSEGELRIAESTDNLDLVGTASGSLIGMLVGVLGGPLGVLLGWGAGAMMGAAFDVDRDETSDEALVVLGRAIPPGSTAVIASVDESAVELIDGEMAKLDGEVTRRSVGEVMGELEVAEDAAEAAAHEARRTIREERKAELSAGFEDRVGQAEGEAPRVVTAAPRAADRSPSAREVGGLRRLYGRGSRTRRARGWMANRMGGMRPTASPSIPASTGAGAATSSRAVVHVSPGL